LSLIRFTHRAIGQGDDRVVCMSVKERLLREGFELAAPPVALGAYLPAARTGQLVFTSGQLPLLEGALLATGRVDEDVPADLARRCAERCALNALAAASSVCDLDRVARVVKVVGYVASSPAFSGQPAVIDGASSVMAIAFGDAGRHAREAVGVASLPLGAPVEISLVLEVS
jgi:enamine deaminase RidA (YjgF/YER057c/UK114 family)